MTLLVRWCTKVFPARAGMSRIGPTQAKRKPGFPRPRGDEPREQAVEALRAQFSPPARG